MNLLLLIGLDMLGLGLIATGVQMARVEGRKEWPLFVPLILIGVTVFAGALTSTLGGSS